MGKSSIEAPALTANSETMTGNIDLGEMLQTFIAAKRNKNLLEITPIHRFTSIKMQLSALWKSILYGFVDHILYQSQITQSPTLLQETIILPRDEENWLLMYVSNMRMNKLATRGLCKFLAQWIHLLELSLLLLSQNSIRTVTICFGKTLKRLTSSFSLGLSDFDKETFLPMWVLLSDIQQKEFCNSVGRIIVRKSLQMISGNSFLSSKIYLHDKCFFALETTIANFDPPEKLETMLINDSLWGTFRSISSEIFSPIPQLKRKRKRNVLKSKRISTKQRHLDRSKNILNENLMEEAVVPICDINAPDELLQDKPEPHSSIINLFSSSASQQGLLLRNNIWLVSCKGIKAPKV